VQQAWQRKRLAPLTCRETIDELLRALEFIEVMVRKSFVRPGT